MQHVPAEPTVLLVPEAGIHPPLLSSPSCPAARGSSKPPRAAPAAAAARKAAPAAATGRGKQTKLATVRQSPLNLGPSRSGSRGTQQDDNSVTVGVAAGRRGSSRAAAVKAQQKLASTFK